MKQAQLVSPGSISRMLKAADEAWKRKDLTQAIEVLQRAARLAPANVAVLLQLGWFHGLSYNYAEAENCFEKAVRFSPNKTQTLVAAGENCRVFRNLELAQRYFERAGQQKDATPETLVHLAEFYERARRTEDASALVNRALESDAACALALLARARLDRQSGRLEQAEHAIRSLLNRPEPGPQPGPERDARVRAWYELGAILDRQKRFDDAMAAFLEAKSMLRLHAGQQVAELKAVRARLAEVRDKVSAEHFERWFKTGTQLQPARRIALLGGHPRSGTTLLEQVLDSHPDIVSAEETEVFHDDACLPLQRELPDNAAMLDVLDSATVPALQRSREGYFRSIELGLGKPVGNRLLIDKNPSYTFLVPALVRIFPEIKLLVAVRDPRDVVLSCFMQAFVPLGRTTSAYLSLENTAAEYAALMNMWRTTAPLLRNPWLEVRYEDMVEDLESVSRRVLEFLGAPWNAGVLSFDAHARQKMVRSPTYADVTKPVFKTAVGRWRNYGKFLEPHLKTLEPFVKAFGYE